MPNELKDLKAKINNSISIFNKVKDDINGDRHNGLVSACNMILEMIEEMEGEYNAR